MADPFSIASAAFSLSFSVSNAIQKIALFVLDVRQARKDLDAVVREMMSLQLCLDTMRADIQRRGTIFPTGLNDRVRQIFVACEINVERIVLIMSKLQSGKINRRIQWALSEKYETDKIRSSLESHKSALEIIMTIGIVSTLTRQHDMILRQDGDLGLLIQQNQSVLASTSRIESRVEVLTGIQQDTSLIAGIATAMFELRSQIASLDSRGHISPNLQLIVEESRSYVTQIENVVPSAIQPATDESRFSEEPFRVSSDEGRNQFQCPRDFGTCSVCCNRLASKEEKARVDGFYERQHRARANWQTQVQHAEAHVAELTNKVTILEQCLKDVRAFRANDEVADRPASTTTSAQSTGSRTTVNELGSGLSHIESLLNPVGDGYERLSITPGSLPVVREQKQVEKPFQNGGHEAFLIFTPVVRDQFSPMEMILSRSFTEAFMPLVPAGISVSELEDCIQKVFKHIFIYPKHSMRYHIISTIVCEANAVAPWVFAYLRKDVLYLREIESDKRKVLNDADALDEHFFASDGTIEDIWIMIKPLAEPPFGIPFEITSTTWKAEYPYDLEIPPSGHTDVLLLMLKFVYRRDDDVLQFEIQNCNVPADDWGYLTHLRSHIANLFPPSFTSESLDGAMFKDLRYYIAERIFGDSKVLLWVEESKIRLRLEGSPWPWSYEPKRKEYIADHCDRYRYIKVIWPAKRNP